MSNLPYDLLTSPRSSEMLMHALGRVDKDDAPVLRRLLPSLLEHPLPEVRAAALTAAFVVCHLPGYDSDVRIMLALDPDDEVRGAAAFALISTPSDMPEQTANAHALLAALERDPATEVQRSAYVALMIRAGRTDLPTATSDFDPQKDVDWAWIAEQRMLLGDV